MITKTDNPISNHLGFVFNEIILPNLAPIIEPITTTNAGKNTISPRYQKMMTPAEAVKIVTNNDVAIAL